MKKYTDDIPAELANRAHAFTSHVPDERGAQERAEYAHALSADYEALSALADTDDKRADLEREFERYRSGYRARYLAYLAARGRCASTMITGGSNFNTARNDRANRHADKRSMALAEFRKRAVAAIRKVLTPECAPIMKGDADAAERLREKIARAEKLQAEMKACNAAIRKHKTAAAQAGAIIALGIGFTLKNVGKLLEPDFAGRIGFPDFELKNNNANIRRMRARLVEVERAHSTPASEIQGEHARVEDAPAENRVRLYFPGKPSAEVRAKLKSSGFRWAPSQGAWSAYRNQYTLDVARAVAGAKEG